ncbi:cation:proton antiporter [Naasia sp. SYSU D00057]|uniref:cation:proton antiporter n=1 Tax=Naasia sp. SYSU D00057 TaxID=2817380 RepID=UPI001B315226|nr:cation:proton antiporter [Naasia sp. SYSU D00057]
MRPPLETIILFAGIAAAAPVLSALFGRAARVPIVVFEIVLGILLGPAVLGWITVNEFTTFLAAVGLATLFFLAGSEIDFTALRSRATGAAVLGWAISLVLGLALGLLIGGSLAAAVFVGIALTTTSLGAILPLLRDAGELPTPFGRSVMTIGAVGEFAPLVAISLFLSGRSPALAGVVLIGFVIVATVAIILAARGPYPALHRLITATLHTSGQFAVRLVLGILAVLTCASIAIGLDMLLGSFTAGVLARVLLSAAPPDERESVESKLEAVGFGFLVPIFFINTGVTFPLGSLLEDVRALLLVPLFLVLMLVVRGLPGLLGAATRTHWDRGAAVLLAATGLPIIVAVTALGVQAGDLTPGIAAALVGAGMLSVLLFPLVGLALRGRGQRTAAPAAAEDPAATEG